MAESDILKRLVDDVYERGTLFGVDRPFPTDPLIATAPGARSHSIAVAGAAFGDEGKGRIVDDLLRAWGTDQHEPALVYRWNGGANAGHTVLVDGQRVALHQLPSGMVFANAISMMGRGMVVHPADLVEELAQLRASLGSGPNPGAPRLFIDRGTVLALDTHRAFESALRAWAEGGKGATGRGISPAYADVLLRHPVRISDLCAVEWVARLGGHYDLYAALVAGLGLELATISVPTLRGEPMLVGDRAVFLERLATHRETLKSLAVDTRERLRQAWTGSALIIFEGAQAIGLDPRFGVYPDVTASDPTYDGITHSTEGLIRRDMIGVRVGAIKATYTSSVGTRRLPTMMDKTEPDRALADRIREHAHEYGATTRRPRDIAFIDIPCLRFFAQVSGMTHLVLTHLDIAYSETPIRVCTHYTDASGAEVGYRPDQDYLNGVTPHYVELPSWDGAVLRDARQPGDLPSATLRYIAFLTQALGIPPLMGTTGPEPDAVITWRGGGASAAAGT